MTTPPDRLLHGYIIASTTGAAAAASAARSGTSIGHPYTSPSHSIEKLDGSMATGKSNYVSWRFRVLRIHKEKGLASAVVDMAADGADSSSNTATTERVNDQAFTIICLNIHDSQIPHIQAASNAKEAWDALANVYQGIGANGRMVLMQRLWGLHLKEGQDVSVHLNSFKELSTQVANLSPNRVGIPDGDLVSMLSLSLPPSYEPLIMAVQSRTDTVTFEFLCGRLLQEATRRQAASSSTADADLQPLSAMAAQSGSWSCWQYGRESHSMGNRGIPRGASGRGSRGGSSGGLRGRGYSQMEKAGRCHYSDKEGHWKNECLKRKGDLQKSSGGGHLAFVGLASQQARVSDWIIDSEASRHLTAHKGLLEEYASISATGIMIGNGKEITAVGEGNIRIPTALGSIFLAKVLHVPDIGTNLISVASIVDQGF